MTGFLEKLRKNWIAPFIAIIGGLIGVYFTIVKNSLETQASNLNNVALRIETQLKEKEFANDLKMHMYMEVKDAIMHNDKKLQSAVLLIVNELLADDSVFRDKLVYILNTSPNTNDSIKVEIRKIEKKENVFYKEQLLNTKKEFIIDVFFVEGLSKDSMPKISAIVKILEAQCPGYLIRQRLLPNSINAQNRYRIKNNEIRYNTDELDLAKKCQQIIKSSGLLTTEQPQLRLMYRVTPNYMSIFIRNI